ncbi:uncharacterized protein LOC130828587 [Amaranthus tricolor]|uniref:uncharacterized protein LOC130828587 n=1 Tax=Amaranthus tricolor TaxID=29722 RepID=UPI00258673B6|nr:uncharacterized protein LOC130828587 [Amaranthus tricolor]
MRVDEFSLDKKTSKCGGIKEVGEALKVMGRTKAVGPANIPIEVYENYRGIKLLSHTTKLWERVIERRIRQETRIRENQFGFMPGRSTTEAIHLLRRVVEKHRERNKDLHMSIDSHSDTGGIIESFPIKVRLHQNDIILVAEIKEEANSKFEEWRAVLEGRGGRELIGEPEVTIGGDVVACTSKFKYLGSVIQSDGEIDGDVTYRI